MEIPKHTLRTFSAMFMRILNVQAVYFGMSLYVMHKVRAGEEV